MELRGSDRTLKQKIQLLGKRHRISRVHVGDQTPQIRPNHLFVLSSGPVNGMIGGGILDTRPNECAPIIAFSSEPVVKGLKETKDTILRAARTSLD